MSIFLSKLLSYCSIVIICINFCNNQVLNEWIVNINDETASYDLKKLNHLGFTVNKVKIAF